MLWNAQDIYFFKKKAMFDKNSQHGIKGKRARDQKNNEVKKAKRLEIVAEVNLHFLNIGERLASEIPEYDIEPETYLTPTETSYSSEHQYFASIFGMQNNEFFAWRKTDTAVRTGPGLT